MKLVPDKPKKSLKHLSTLRPLRSEMDLFKDNLKKLLGNIDEIEREENQKNHIRDFLLNTYYKNTNEINTKKDIDLVIRVGPSNKDKVGVLIEAKRPSNTSEWISADQPNGKALHELVLYYLRERIEENNIDIKYCIATNINEWFIIDAKYFDKYFYENKSFVKDYEKWRDGNKVTQKTDLFYNDIAKPYIERINDDIPCTFFDLTFRDNVLFSEKHS